MFVSPLKIRKKPAPVADSDSEVARTDNSLPKNKGKRTIREMVEQKRIAMTTPANSKRVQIKPAGNSKKVRFNF